MRFFILGNFNTWHDWRLTLTAKEVSPPQPKTSYIKLDGRHGSLDLSEALTGGVVYEDRTVQAKFWTSEGTDTGRVQLMREIIAALHGRKVQIIEPDDPDHFFLGRVFIKPDAHDQVHDEFTLEAVCEPWRYALTETRRRVEVNSDSVATIIRNNGVKTLSPTVEVEGSVTLEYNGATVDLTAGSYKISDIKLHQGFNTVGVSGTGSVTFIYREATL